MLKVFYADITDCDYNSSLIADFDEKRKGYLQGITANTRKKQSVFVWLLLKFALNSFGVNGSFFMDEHGKWHIENDKVQFSLSHSKNIVSVAVSNDQSIGLDVEFCSERVLKLKEKFKIDIPCDVNPIEFLTLEWTKRESEFKSGKIGNIYSQKILDKIGGEYLITLCADDFNGEFTRVDTEKLLLKY